jgi:hypothetical protein
VIRKYPTDGSTATMYKGFWACGTATGKMEGNVLTGDTNPSEWHDVWILSEDVKRYTDEMSSTPPPGRYFNRPMRQTSASIFQLTCFEIMASCAQELRIIL